MAHLEAILKEWETLKRDLINGVADVFSVEEIVTRYHFPRMFQEIIQQTGNLFELHVDEIGPIYKARGFVVPFEKSHQIVTTKEWARSHNRMNPPGEAFNYFGVLPINKGPKEEISKHLILPTLKAEIRAEKGQMITICRFKVSEAVKIFNMYPHHEVPSDIFEFSNFLESKISKLKGNVSTKEVKTKACINEMMAKYFFNLINSEEIFKPIDSKVREERANEYAPFQFLARYVKSMGYDAIKYKSTVYKNGANLVIFNPNHLSMISETIEYIKVE